MDAEYPPISQSQEDIKQDTPTKEEEKRTLRVRKYKAGYEVREELVSGYGRPMVMKTAYTPEGHYIGNPKVANRLCKKRGIKPELRTPSSNVCSIGFCEKEQKWYGWSHRAMYGFGIGSKTKKGDCGYKPANKEDFIEDVKRFWDNNTYEVTNEGVLCTSQGMAYGSGKLEEKIIHPRPARLSHIELFPTIWGRGEWTAKTMEDAKQMAEDFAEGVS